MDNLRIELTSRPSVKQWHQQQLETREAEEKLHDLIVMRRESAELHGQRKHMSSKEKMCVDKKNYEMGLWILDSLPSEVTKEALRSVCRELGLSDVSEVQPALVKLKTVVGAVPRMERFITQVCNFIFRCEEEAVARHDGRGRDRDRDRQGRQQSGSMEDVLPLLER